MRIDFKSVIEKLSILSISLLVFLVLLEVALRLFFPVTDWPLRQYEPGIGLHLAPNQSGTFVLGATGEGVGNFRTNAAGWNSLHEYQRSKPDGTLRIAVIGDSFVEALQVDVDKAFPGLVEATMEASPSCADYDTIEVYSYGASGAPLSQYLNVMRHVAEQHDPDVFIITIFPGNDVEQSLRSEDPAISSFSYFLSFEQNSEGDFEEVGPYPWVPSRVRRFLVRFALVRYLYGNLKVESVAPFLRSLFQVKGAAGETPQERDGGADNDTLGTASFSVDPHVWDELVRYIFQEYQQVAEQNNSQLLLIMDANRRAIYDDNWAPSSPASIQYEQLISETAESQDIDFIDLTSAFTADYQKHGERFEFVVDYHWNERGHRIVAEVVSNRVISDICSE